MTARATAQDDPKALLDKTSPTAWRQTRPVMVMQASALGAIAVIRSLGRAGYPVHACSSDPDALGLFSTFAGQRVLHPDHRDPAFLPWLRGYLDAQDIAAIVPSEGFLHAVRPVFDEVADLLPVSADPAIVYRALSKTATLERLFGAGTGEDLSANVPPSLIVRDAAALAGPPALHSLGLPLFIKVDACHGGRHLENQVVKAETAGEALDSIARLLRDYSEVLVQGFVPGNKIAADFCIHRGEVVVASMWEAQHENPHRGGVASLRRVCWRQEVHDDALKKLRHLNWEGVAMMEYRRDPETGRFYFIELNARYWGGLHAELFAGIDLPRLQIDRFLGAPAEETPSPAKSVPCRHTVPGDIGYLLSRLRDRHLSSRQKVWSMLEFLLLSLDPRVKSDLNFPGDRGLYLRQWKTWLLSLLRRSRDRAAGKP